MTGMVFRLWTMSIRAGVLILIVLAVRACLKKYPKIYSYCLWIPVGLRLLCPVCIESPFSLPSVPHFPEHSAATQSAGTTEQAVAAGQILPGQAAQDTGQSPEPEIKAPGKAERPYGDVQLTEQAEGRTGNGAVSAEPEEAIRTLFLDLVKGGEPSVGTDILKLPAVIYLAVSACLMAVYLAGYMRMKQKMATAVWKQENIWLNGEIRSPFVMGIRKPEIYLPYDMADDPFFTDSGFINDIRNDSGSGFYSRETALILEHERTHIRHHDPLVRMAGICCVCLHWWNPLVWLAVRRMNEDMEMFCDETVLRSASAGERKDYANALLSFAVKESGLRAGPAFGKSNTEKRIQNIFHNRKKDRRVSVTAVFLVALCAAVLFLMPEQTRGSRAQRRAVSGTVPEIFAEKTENNAAAVQTSSRAYTAYTGYMDECREWTGYMAFAGQDYDGDGLTDRVYRTYYKDSGYCHYQIRFGNRDVLDCDKDVYADGKPSVKAADINGDGYNEIILMLQYDTGTDMRAFGDLAVFEKKDGETYARAELPFKEREEDYALEVRMGFRMKREQLLTVSLDGTDFAVDVPVSNWLWEDAQYKDMFREGVGGAAVWDAFLAGDGQDVRLACKVHLFDKWSDYGLILLLGCDNGRYVVEDVIPARDEFADVLPDTKQTWNLSEYRLCAKEMQLAGGRPVVLELWLKEGEYVTGYDAVPGAGTYEENYRGDYVLVTRDRKGNVLDQYGLNRQPEGSPENIFGARANFSGPFDIVTADYNGDGSPDFTIGVELSSVMNFFVLYHRGGHYDKMRLKGFKL